MGKAFGMITNAFVWKLIMHFSVPSSRERAIYAAKLNPFKFNIRKLIKADFS